MILVIPESSDTTTIAAIAASAFAKPNQCTAPIAAKPAVASPATISLAHKFFPLVISSRFALIASASSISTKAKNRRKRRF
jgi:hypothetical protein